MHKDLIKKWNTIELEEKSAIFSEAGKKVDLPASAIEKDWWITTAIRIVFSLPDAKHFVFKGGTSLSKGWNLIERFSEDIDIAIDRRFLGFKGDLTNNQIGRLRRKSCEYISTLFANAISKKIKELGILELTLNIPQIEASDTDPVAVELNYKSLTDDSPYLQPRVLLEVGARALMEPIEGREIQSIVGSQFSTKGFADKPISISTVLPKKTFLEKAFLLHEEFQKPVEKIRVERLSRHLYDLDKLFNTPHGEKALNDPDLYKTILSHREKFNHIRRVNYRNHLPDKIDFVPPKAVFQKWKTDYNKMKESMIYGESKNFDELIMSIKSIRERFRRIKV